MAPASRRATPDLCPPLTTPVESIQYGAMSELTSSPSEDVWPVLAWEAEDVDEEDLDLEDEEDLDDEDDLFDDDDDDDEYVDDDDEDDPLDEDEFDEDDEDEVEDEDEEV